MMRHRPPGARSPWRMTDARSRGVRSTSRRRCWPRGSTSEDVCRSRDSECSKQTAADRAAAGRLVGDGDRREAEPDGAPVPRQGRLVQRELVSSGRLVVDPVLMAAELCRLPWRGARWRRMDAQHAPADARRRRPRTWPSGDDLLVVPEQRTPEVGARIMHFEEPTRKMLDARDLGTAEGDGARRVDQPVIEKKLKRAVTDSGADTSAWTSRGLEPHRHPRRRRSRMPMLSRPTWPTPAATVAAPKAATAAAWSIARRRQPVRGRYAELRGDEERLEESWRSAGEGPA